MRLQQSQIRTYAGFGGTSPVAGYGFQPRSVEEIASVLQFAQKSGRKVALRGAGRSYGDAATLSEEIVLNCTQLNALTIDQETGIAEAECGVTIQDLWQTGLPMGYWPPVVSGTMFPTLGGALAMNIHGKNAFKAGTLGDHVLELEVMFANGEIRALAPSDELFQAVISSAGLLGVITKVKLQMKRVKSGNLKVLPVSCRNWDEQFDAFEEHIDSADYMVSWIDAFSSGAQSGRGQFHAGWHVLDDDSNSLTLEYQDLPSRILGIVPKSEVWRILRLANNDLGMKALNAAKQSAGRLLGDRGEYIQSLVAFSFLLDYVPGWQRAYDPHGFIQYQSFLPRDSAKEVFAKQLEMQREAGLPNYLTVLKRHRPDSFLFSHGVDGYSLAQDFKVHPRTWPKLQQLCHAMNELVLANGGRFYLAKDSTLRPGGFHSSIGDDQLARFKRLKSDLDPYGVFDTELAKRLNLR